MVEKCNEIPLYRLTFVNGKYIYAGALSKSHSMTTSHRSRSFAFEDWQSPRSPTSTSSFLDKVSTPSLSSSISQTSPRYTPTTLPCASSESPDRERGEPIRRIFRLPSSIDIDPSESSSASTKATAPGLLKTLLTTLLILAVTKCFFTSTPCASTLTTELSNCSLFIPISNTQPRTSAAMPPGTYPGTSCLPRPRR